MRGSCAAGAGRREPADRKSVGEGKRGDLGGRRIIKKKKKMIEQREADDNGIENCNKIKTTSEGVMAESEYRRIGLKPTYSDYATDETVQTVCVCSTR